MAAEVEGGRARPWWVAGVAGVVALAALVGVLVAIRRDPEAAAPRDRVAEAAATAATWLRAWAADDREAVGRLVERSSDELTASLDELRALRPASVRAVAGVPVVDGATARVSFDAEVTLAGLGVWRYAGTIPLVDVQVEVDGDEEEQWRVAFAPSVVHPELQAGDDLELDVAWPARGELQADDGTPLPAGHALGTILGAIGPASAARAEELGGPYRTGDVVGLAGLQATYERDLAGTPSGELRLVRGGRTVKVQASFDATPGRSIRTTINLAAQRAAEAALGAEGGAAALVAIKPSTGGIVAVANRPQRGFSRALTGRYPPGSTFKVVTTLALLLKGVTPETPVACPKETTVNGRTFRNAEEEELGNVTFRDAFFHSCNTAFAELAQRLTPEDLVAAAKLFGFNTDMSAGTSLPRSEVPLPRGTVDLVSAAIGQSRLSVTPLQMASVAATVANGSYRMPHFVDQLDNMGSTPLPAGTASTLQALMRLVVASGTGRKAALPGTPVSGKTGTAEFGTADPPKTHAWFISFRGDLAASVIVEDAPGFGGDISAPIAADFYRRTGS
jgi:hypothetical protein